MKVRQWFRPPRHVPAIFIAVTMVSAGALGWLMWSLLEQDKTVELQRRQERLEQAADRAVAIMQAALGDLDRDTPPGVLVVTLRPDGLAVRPQGSLLYYPDFPRPADRPARFLEGEQAEFARKDLKAARDIYARLSMDADKTVRAGALARLGRVERKLQQYDAALRTYTGLSLLGQIDVSALPAGLISHEGRATVFAELHQTMELREEAGALERDLNAGIWRLTESEYHFYAAEAAAWLDEKTASADPDQVARAEAVNWLWQNAGDNEHNFRRAIHTGAGPALVLSRSADAGLTASVGGPRYFASLCHDAIPEATLRCTLTDAEGRNISGPAPPSRLAAVRTASASKLPWTLQVFSQPDGAAPGVSPRRNLLLGMGAALALVWLTAAAFIARAIARESRVAQLQSDFVAAVSHEFRSPLSSLCQISEMLAGHRMPTEELRGNAYAVLARESNRLRRLVEALLDFQRLDAGAAVYHFERVELCGFVRSIVAEFQERVAAAGYTVELRGAEAPLYVRADREALARAVWNLLDNAVKYSPEKHSVWVEVAFNGEQVALAVQDHGLGIPAGEHKEIFEKFVRGAESKSRRIKGTGIGLAMVRHIVQAHGGTILLSSRPGEGSRFTIVIPGGAHS